MKLPHRITAIGVLHLDVLAYHFLCSGEDREDCLKGVQEDLLQVPGYYANYVTSCENKQ